MFSAASCVLRAARLSGVSRSRPFGADSFISCCADADNAADTATVALMPSAAAFCAVAATSYVVDAASMAACAWSCSLL
ncbi:hypothetical protein D4765_13985 [Subtercola vilae]|uniref:Uncharacterized protein n=1 Tax=Subtercola vilae TaxID=2056433 RepID=A0A4T2BRU8_9MICO|nr:hypothetical protein D4765_13985 [Subtercola vilae]